MAEELFVDLQYQGLELGRRVRMEEFAATQAYVHHPTPMPVGSALLIDAGEGIEIPVQVSRVNEQVAGSERPPGMFVTPLVLPQVAQNWWDARVSATDSPVAIVEVLAPEPAAEPPSAEPELAAATELSDESAGAVSDERDTQVMDVVTASEVEVAPVDADSEESSPKGKKKRRRKKRPTKA